MESIKQKLDRTGPQRLLPDFRNLGVVLRVLVLVNLLGLATVLVQHSTMAGLGDALLRMAGGLELPLFVAILILYLLQPWLARLSCWLWRLLLLVIVAGVVVVVTVLGSGEQAAWRAVTWGLAACVVCMAYLDCRSQRFSPALTEARLMALTARIRPHFFFNALNGVLGVIRSDPRRAERTLEELAELFRVLMRDNRNLVPLADEIRLCERYIEVEQLRLGDRLQVAWLLDGCPRDALVPPLMLQPLLENAVYHGVEPASGPAELVVRARKRGGEIWLEVENPMGDDDQRHHVGNRMAMANIRERLMLFFDLDARLEKDVRAGRYRVTIRLPYRSTQR